MIKLDPILDSEEEEEILTAFLNGTLKPANNATQMMEQHRIAAELFANTAHIDIALPVTDLQSLQTQAREKGISYQTLITSILHKFVSGRFIEVSSSI